MEWIGPALPAECDGLFETVLAPPAEYNAHVRG
jgi:hypothetical protein